jgi:hypothetical protein
MGISAHDCHSQLAYVNVAFDTECAPVMPPNMYGRLDNMTGGEHM